MLLYMYIALRQGQTTPWGQNFDDNRKAFSLYPYSASFKWSLQNLILYTFLMILYMYIAPGQGQQTLWGQTLVSTESPYHFNHLLQVSNKSLWIMILHTFFNVFPYVYNPGAGAVNLCGQTPDVNRKAFSLCPFVASFKKISLTSDFIHNFSCFYTWRQNFYVNIYLMSLWSFA